MISSAMLEKADRFIAETRKRNDKVLLAYCLREVSQSVQDDDDIRLSVLLADFHG